MGGFHICFTNECLFFNAINVTIYNSASFESVGVGFEPRSPFLGVAIHCCTDGTAVVVGDLTSRMTIGLVLHRSYH